MHDLYRTFFHAQRQGSALLQRKSPDEFIILDINEAAAEAAGWDYATLPEKVGQNIADVFDGVREYGLLDRYNETLDTGRPLSLGYFDYQDSSTRQGTYEIKLVPLGPELLWIDFSNVTKRLRAERALQHQVQLLGQVQQMAHVGHWQIDLPARTLSWSDEMYRIHGLTRDAFSPTLQTALATYHDEDRAGVAALIERALDSGQGFDTEFRLLRPDGDVRHVALHGKCIVDEAGNVEAVFGIKLDLTEHKLAAEALRERESLIRSILQSSAIGIITIDEQGRVESFNDRAEALFGYTREEVIGQNINRLMPPPYRGEHDGYLDTYGRTGQAKIIGLGRDVVARRKDGTTFPIHLSVSENNLGSRRLYTGMVIDITERKAAEEALQGYIEALKLSNEELEHFAYVASHDLQEPLRTVSSFARLLQQRYGEQFDADADEFIDFIVEGTERMQALIKALLSYSRVGRQDLKRMPVSVEKLVQRTLDGLRSMIDEAGAEISLSSFPTVRADPVLLGLVLQNLISNAIKFRGAAPLRIHISCEKTGTMWRFAVCDNGIGIDMSYRDRIFEVFKRLHSRRKYAGTGIGLAVCKKIVERHGGRIWVESEPGKGATFLFTLPETP